MCDSDGILSHAARRRYPGSGIASGSLDSKTFVPILKQALEDSAMDPSLAVPALNALADQGDAGIAVLLDELKNEKGRYWATIALA